MVSLISVTLLSLMALVIFKFHRLSSKLTLANDELNDLVRTDHLTHVRNRYGFLELAPIILHQSLRHNVASSFILFDIDHFKLINDQYGHQAGDSVLTAFAQALSEHRREHDIVARLGGEEFGMLLTGANVTEASNITEQILKKVRELQTTCPNTGRIISITASAGIAAATENLEQCWFDADKALYKAKEAGRDSYCIAADV